MSIKKKLVFYSYLILTPLLILISTLLGIWNYKKAVQAERENYRQSVHSISDSIETMQHSIMELGTYISINTEINRILTAEDDEVLMLNQDSQLWNHSAPMKIIQDIVAIDGQMKTVAIYPENGVNPYLRCMDSSAYLPNFSEIRKSGIYKQAVESGENYVWQRVRKGGSDTYSSNRGEKIVMYREICDLSRKHRLSYLVIGSSADRFDEICENSLKKNGEEIVVLSANGARLVSCGDLGEDIIDHVLKASEGKNEYSYMDYNIYSYKIEDTGTTVFWIVPHTGMAEMLSSVLIGPFALLFGVLVGLLPVLLLISRIITKPLEALCVAMRRFKKGDFSQQVEVKTRDEVGEVSAVFNEMVDDMKRLIDENYVITLKEKESELDVLQAQINPHFLYNALDTLYWKAEENDNEEMAEDILALSDLFRLVLNRGESIVTVETECQLLDRYLHIQKMRFGKRLNYEFQIAEDVRQERILKLILQPFVENAIVHGFEKGREAFKLLICGQKEGDMLIFRVIDTGVGMTQEQLAEIWQENGRKYAGQRIGRYAIKNVKERLELKYAGRCDLIVESEPGKGTRVTITVPCIGKEENK